uniref:Aquaporin-like protein n=1 Tax=Globodera rostochiensis TaxID=31243 RepID=A0A914GWI1_GLORO
MQSPRQQQSHPPQTIAHEPAVAAPTALLKCDVVVPFDPCRRAYAPFAVEFLASFVFTLFTDLLSVLLLPPATDRLSFQLQNIAPFEGALSLALICAFRPIGTHFNPAVTLASMLTLGTPVLLGLALLFAQFFGSFFGALLFRSSISSAAFIDASLQLGTIRTVTESLAQLEERQNGRISDEMSETDMSGRSSPFSNRLQMFISESLCSLLMVLAHLFSSALSHSDRNSSILPQAFSVASARTVATAVGARSPLGQNANLARATANALMTAIFTRPDEFVMWRFFYIHLFGAFCSAIVGAATFWVVKCSLAENQQQQPPAGGS